MKKLIIFLMLCGAWAVGQEKPKTVPEVFLMKSYQEQIDKLQEQIDRLKAVQINPTIYPIFQFGWLIGMDDKGIRKLHLHTESDWETLGGMTVLPHLFSASYPLQRCKVCGVLRVKPELPK